MNDSQLSCQEKLAFDSRREAEAAATVAKFQHGSNLKVYQCTHCGLWHLATNYDDRAI